MFSVPKNLLWCIDSGSLISNSITLQWKREKFLFYLSAYRLKSHLLFYAVKTYSKNYNFQYDLQRQWAKENYLNLE